MNTKGFGAVILAAAVSISLPTAAGSAGSGGGGSWSAPSVPDDTGNGAVDGWSDVEAAARAEGEVVWYSAYIESQVQAIESAFENTYPGIDLQYVRGVPADLHPRVEQELQTGAAGADVVSSTDEGWLRGGNAQGWWAEAQGPSVENPDLDTDRWVPEGTWAVTSFNIVGIGWNTNNVSESEAPKGIADLLDERFGGGRLGVPDLAISPNVADFYQFLEDELGSDALERLAGLDPVFFAGGAPLRQALVAGEVDAVLFTGTLLQDEADAGAPVALLVPEVAWATPFGTGAIVGAAHPNAALLLVDFLLSMEGQEVLAADNAGVLPGIEGTYLEPDAVRLPLPERVAPEAVAEFTERFNEVMGR